MMRIDKPMDVMQNRAQVQPGGGQQEAMKEPASAQPEAQTPSPAESSPAANQGNSLLGRLATLDGGNQLLVHETTIPVAVDFGKVKQKSTEDEYVYLTGEIDSPAEIKDLLGAVDKHQANITFIQTIGDQTRYFKPALHDTKGKATGFIEKVNSLRSNPAETFTLHDYDDDLNPLEKLNSNQMTALRSLWADDLGKAAAVGDRGAALLAVVKNPKVLEVAQHLGVKQFDVLSKLTDKQFEAIKQIPAPTQVFNGVFSGDDYTAAYEIPADILPKLQQLSTEEFALLKGLKGMTFSDGLGVLNWRPEQLNALKAMDLNQFNKLQQMSPEGLKKLKTFSER